MPAIWTCPAFSKSRSRHGASSPPFPSRLAYDGVTIRNARKPASRSVDLDPRQPDCGANRDQPSLSTTFICSTFMRPPSTVTPAKAASMSRRSSDDRSTSIAPTMSRTAARCACRGSKRSTAAAPSPTPARSGAGSPPRTSHSRPVGRGCAGSPPALRVGHGRSISISGHFPRDRQRARPRRGDRAVDRHIGNIDTMFRTFSISTWATAHWPRDDRESA